MFPLPMDFSPNASPCCAPLPGAMYWGQGHGPIMVPSWSHCQQKPFGSRNRVVVVTLLDICPLPHVPSRLWTRAAQPAAPSPSQPTFSALQRPRWDNLGLRGAQKIPGELASYKHSGVGFIFSSITFPSLCEFFFAARAGLVCWERALGSEPEAPTHTA